ADEKVAARAPRVGDEESKDHRDEHRDERQTEGQPRPPFREKLTRAQPDECTIDFGEPAHRSTRYEKTLSSDSSVGRISRRRMPAVFAVRGRCRVNAPRSAVRNTIPAA